MQTALSLVLGLGGLALANRPVSADAPYGNGAAWDPGRRPWYSYAWTEPSLDSRIGIGLMLGGAAAGFTDPAVRDLLKTGVGGNWSARSIFGTHVPIGAELNYIGTAANLQSLGGEANGVLIGTTFEAALRYNVFPHAQWNPYAFGGYGWTRYNVTEAQLAQADTGLREETDLAVFPIGTGIAYRDRSGAFADIRTTFRFATESDFIENRRNGGNAMLHNWEAGGSIGYEF